MTILRTARRGPLSLAIVLLLCAALPAQAALVRLALSGEIETGAAFGGVFVYDTEATDLSVDPRFGYFRLDSWRIDIEGLTLLADTELDAEAFISIRNEFPDLGEPSTLVLDFQQTTFRAGFEQLRIAFEIPIPAGSPNMLALPPQRLVDTIFTDPGVLGDPPSSGVGGDVYLDRPLTELRVTEADIFVPVPASLPLLGSAALLLVGLRRARRRT